MEILFVDTPEKLQLLCSRLRGSTALALDTEFKRESTYYAQLCLIQVANDQLIACIDPISVPDLAPLLEIFYDPAVTKVIHAARQDLELFFDIKGSLPQPVFDTQIAATVLGYGDQVGYAKLVKAICGVSLAKGETRTDWSRRPLTQRQVHYAEDDVRYLLAVYEQLKAQLAAKGRLDWLEHDFQQLTAVELYQPCFDELWLRVKGVQTLKPADLPVLQQLSAWREQRAQEKNKPRRWLLADDTLLEIARHKPVNQHALEKIRGWSSKQAAYMQEVLTQVEQGLQLPAERWPQLPKQRILSPEEDALVDVMMGIARKVAADNEVTPAILATRKDLERFVQGQQRELSLLQGWRYQLLGRCLQQFMDGKLLVSRGDTAALVLTSTGE